MVTLEQLSTNLDIDLKNLTYIVYKIPDNEKYEIFPIPKKGGGQRQICKPLPRLHNLQRKIKDYLLTFYISKPCSFGFEINRDIKQNALRHVKSRLVLNIDIEDFFGSINFGRIYGLLQSAPFNFDAKAAAAIAKAVTFNNKLPQGAPTSPILSNMIARRLDNKLLSLASTTKSFYTRYVDDITFSTTLPEFDNKIILRDNFPNIELSPHLIDILCREGFRINRHKTRLLNGNMRKEVTGITINEFPNVKRNYINSVFGMIYSWKKFGYENAQAAYCAKYLNMRGGSGIKAKSYRSVIVGRISYIAHIRGWDDVVVYKLCRKYCECDNNPPKKIGEIGDMTKEYDVFIGHASEQTDSVLKPLMTSLQALGVKTIADIVCIKWGDSLTKKINAALSQSKYFVAIISIDSIKKSWPDKEMNAAIAREIEGKQIVLPLFVGSKTEIEKCKNHYSLIADKLYKVWENDPDKLAKEISELL